MKNYLLILVCLLAPSALVEAVEKVSVSKSFRDEGSLLLHLRQFNASKRASVVHDGVRYHIYAGGRGSGVRYFNGFVFREMDAAYTLVFHVSYNPFTDNGFRPIMLLTPEIDKTGIRFLVHIAAPIEKRESELARIDFTDLKKVRKEGIDYLALPLQRDE